MEIKTKINRLKELIFDLLLPKICLACDVEGSYLCENCLTKIPLVDRFSCPGCQKISLYGKTCEACQKSYYLDGVIYALDYKNPLVQKMIKLLKYHFVKDLINPLAKILITEIKNSHFLSSNFTADESSFLIIPVPLHRKKFLWRGFNQSELLAEKLAKEFDLTLRTDILIKIKNTKSQTDLKETERHLNVKNTFAVTNGACRPHCSHGFFQNLIFGRQRRPPKHTLLRSLSFGRVSSPSRFNNLYSTLAAEEDKKETRPVRKFNDKLLFINNSKAKPPYGLVSEYTTGPGQTSNGVRGKIIFLIDDVLTTGSTLNEAAKALKKAGAQEVWGITLARG